MRTRVRCMHLRRPGAAGDIRNSCAGGAIYATLAHPARGQSVDQLSIGYPLAPIYVIRLKALDQASLGRRALFMLGSRVAKFETPLYAEFANVRRSRPSSLACTTTSVAPGRPIGRLPARPLDQSVGSYRPRSKR